jgi:hypothetical protein
MARVKRRRVYTGFFLALLLSLKARSTIRAEQLALTYVTKLSSWRKSKVGSRSVEEQSHP